MKHYGILFTRKTGKPVKMVSDNYGNAFIKMYAINNTSPSRDFIIFNADGIVTCYLEGKKNDIPIICEDMVGKHVSEFGFNMADILESECK